MAAVTSIAIAILGVATLANDAGRTKMRQTPPIQVGPVSVERPWKKGGVAPTLIGINLTSVVWYSNQRAFSNLLLGGYWQQTSAAKGWSNLGPPFVDAEGGLLTVPRGADAVRMLTRPDTPTTGSMIRCIYSGRGEVTVRGAVTEVNAAPGQVVFRWVNLWKNSDSWLQVHSVDPSAPLKQIDCREVGASHDARFDPAFVESLKGYRVVRFMDWQRTNFDAPARWSTRHTPASLDVANGTGVAVEDVVTLAKATGADPWVTVPWNADDDYVMRFAQAMHDGIPSDRAVYVELGNEIWNVSFAASRQALAEGQARGLGANPRESLMRRYAQRTIEVMRIWERVFANDPKRLVRIVATQHTVPLGADLVLSYPGLANHVDALATAPYFGADLRAAGATRDLNEIFQRLDAAADVSIIQAAANKEVASRYGKRYLAYEAGQHVLMSDDVPMLEQIERDPRMYHTYRRYIGAWRATVGDVLTLFATTGQIGPGGAWGLVEHSGQSPNDAPKLRAAIEAQVETNANYVNPRRNVGAGRASKR